MTVILGTDKTLHRTHLNRGQHVRQSERGVVLTIHQACDGGRGRISAVNADTLSVPAGFSPPGGLFMHCTGFTKHTEFSIIIL